MTFLEEQLNKIKKDELERLTEVQVENTSFASKIVNDSEFDNEVTEGNNYFEEAFKKIDEDRFNFIESGGTETDAEEQEDALEEQGNDSDVELEENIPEEVQKEEKPVIKQTKKISFFDRLLQLL